ncbi:TerB family tellurite resistance protein [Paralimibaculum aggregatum]|uniref:TerB family tellurite resistance protein n=1 Tax=Paralimibaculum aggregatum TaxID=3036245 RepID=A0ABQ6LCW8_9RHOB|nr:DUF3141 domain-containing protein [Limibaculum sp. NKW23]GMG80832.1 TerB family tellurite resistance protein [Limibaculum sp. NKW23]
MTSQTRAIDAQSNLLRFALPDSTAWSPAARLQVAGASLAELTRTGELMLRAAGRLAETIAKGHRARAEQNVETLTAITEAALARLGTGSVAEDLPAYAADALRRGLVFLDILRERGDIFLEHEAAGCPPVLIYDHEVVLDGAGLPDPCNYMLLKILPPEGCMVDDTKRPFVIIDPRAGHGAGIGGFKTDSQVGVALRAGHPVYFVGFRRMPEPGQTLASVTRAEAAFVREVMRRHPKASNPVVTGNCQGGWAALILAASNPDIVGPLCLNGAPVATWSGEVGTNPMRYNGGVLGGTWQPMFWSDLGHGVFDGAHLVSNFEMLSPGRTLFRKYYDIYAAPEAGRTRFLEFERWWGGFFLLNEAEIRWIVEQLFIGNRLARNEAQLEPGQPIDVKKIRAPIVVFASHGDNITPPQQALNWITDAYADVSEIRIRGQRIIYMVHDQIGHLGIFVSSKIARKEHSEVASTLRTIEALPPGLYEMKIEAYAGAVENRSFTVSFHERTLEDIATLDDGREDEASFAAVARASELQTELYDIAVRPFVQAGATAASAELGRALHPLRLQRAMLSSRNPAMKLLADHVAAGTAPRAALPADNPFLQGERAMADVIEQSLDLARDLRDAWYEMLFHGLWSTPWARWFGRTHARPRRLSSSAELRNLSEVQTALCHISEGGLAEAVVRMLVLMADSRGNVRRDRLERSARVLAEDEPFRSLPAAQRNLMINEQTLIVEFERERAIETLPDLLRTEAERRRALELVRYIPGPVDEMAPDTVELLQRFHRVLGQPPFAGDITEDPFAVPRAPGAAAG